MASRKKSPKKSGSFKWKLLLFLLTVLVLIGCYAYKYPKETGEKIRTLKNRAENTFRKTPYIEE